VTTVAPHSHTSEPDAFDKELCTLVADMAPRLFAVVQVYDTDSGEADGCVAAWGVAYNDGHAHVTSTDGRFQLSLRSPERATRWFARDTGIRTKLVWLVQPRTATLNRTEAI
jgi:hypothetical protein